MWAGVVGPAPFRRTALAQALAARGLAEAGWQALAGSGWQALAGSGWQALAGRQLAGSGRLAGKALAGSGWQGSGRVWLALAGSGRLWQALAGSGRLWQALKSPPPASLFYF